MNKKWWEQFFERGFADFFLKKDKATLDRIAKFLIEKLSLKKGSVVFDQCCGIGEISLALAKRGMRVVGVDQSSLYIKTAEERAKKEKLPGVFYKDDALRFTSKEKCDAAFNWYTSFGYYRDDKKNILMLKRIYESLKNGAYFALDYYNLPFIFRNFEALRLYKRILKGRRVVIKRLSKIDLENGMLVSRWEYNYSRGMTKRFAGETRTYLARDLKEMLSSVGFKKIRFFGDINGVPLGLDSPRCIVIAEKPKRF